MVNPELTFICKIIDIFDLEVFSSGVKKRSINVMVLHRRKVEIFEISFYNKYVGEIDKLNKSGIFKIECIIRSEVFEDKKDEKKTYFTHIIGLTTIKIGNT